MDVFGDALTIAFMRMQLRREEQRPLWTTDDEEARTECGQEGSFRGGTGRVLVMVVLLAAALVPVFVVAVMLL